MRVFQLHRHYDFEVNERNEIKKTRFQDKAYFLQLQKSVIYYG